MARAWVGPEIASRVLGVLLLACALAALTVGRAQAGDAVAAQRAFDEGRALMAANEYAKACSKFEESQRLDSQLGTLLHLANCHEKLGRVASAWRGFSNAIKLAAARNAAGKNEPREATARRRAEDLEWRISWITLDVAPQHAPGLRIELDGQPLDPSQWGQRQAVDPGSHSVTARAPGQQTWNHAYTIEREGTRLRILIPSLRAAAEPPAPPAEAEVERVVVPPGAARSDGELQRIAGYALGGAAIVGAGVAIAFFVAANNASSEQDKYWDRCREPARCSLPDIQQNNRLNDRVHDNATALYIAGGLSAAALITGLTLLLTAPTRERLPDVAMTVLPGQAYLSWRGTPF